MAVQHFLPLTPMLAQTAEGTGEALERLGEAAFEYKLDGARIQLHKQESEIRIFTRSLNEVTAAVPEILQGVRALPLRDLILDGEAIAFPEDGRPRPLHITTRRLGRQLGRAPIRQDIPLQATFLHC